MASPIALVDPGLDAANAHNTAFAALVGTRAIAGPNALGIWCHQSATRDRLAKRIDASVNVYPLFTVDFYALFGSAGVSMDYWPWIRRLGREYESALRQILQLWPGQRVRVLHHTLSWEHAAALVIAIRALGVAGSDLLHLCFAMYAPKNVSRGRGWEGAADLFQRLRFRFAFGGLARLSNVRLFAGCGEYSATLTELLRPERPIPIHPLFLVDGAPAKPYDPDRRTCERPLRTLMYVGVAKNTKGFKRLPERLKQACAASESEDTWVVQYFEAGSAPASAGAKLLKTARSITQTTRLNRLAAKCPKIEIHNAFWNHETLVREFRAADRILLDYDREAYRDKTSGLLWLAAWYGLEVILPRKTWLQREALRLGVRHAVIEEGWPPKVLRWVPAAMSADYRNALFQPFWPWLDSQE